MPLSQYEWGLVHAARKAQGKGGKGEANGKGKGGDGKGGNGQKGKGQGKVGGKPQMNYDNKKCHGCGSQYHLYWRCPHKETQCEACGDWGHPPDRCPLLARADK